MLIKAENFDLTNGSNLVRILCGLFFFPHVAWKFRPRKSPPRRRQ